MILALGLGCGTLAGAATQEEIDRFLEQIRGATLAAEGAVAVEGLLLRAGPATLRLESGTLFPAATVGGRSAELVFLGEARLELETPDEVEADQLELFTGSPTLNEPVEGGVIVVAHDAAAKAVFDRPPAGAVEPAKLERARELFDAWRSSAERRLLNVEGALLADALEDPLAEGYFAGWLEGSTLGRFLYLVEPRAREQVTLGSFVPLDVSRKEERRLRKLVHKQQRRGRLIGLEVETLGQWDAWLSSTLVRDSEPAAGTSGFEAQRYELDVTVSPKHLEIEGRARVEAVATAGRAKVVPFQILSDLRVESAFDSGGSPLPFYQAGGEVMVFLDAPPAAGETAVVELRYRGQAFDEIDVGTAKAFPLRDTLHWYPHVGETDLATYEVTLRWPKGRELMAAGARIAAGVEGGDRWETRRIDRHTKGFTFELGEFKTLEKQVGHVQLTLAIDAASRDLLRGDEALLEWIADSLEFLEEQFGALPVDQLTVVTSPREFSQAMLGFVTLSSLMMVDDALFALLGSEDPRTVITHELSHQWWGHMVTWSSYRDQWMSEALASYSAALHARHRLQNRAALWRGPTSGWETDLFRTATTGHYVDSLGPVVLGARLSSSLSARAYDAIVYKKGALVLGMLARMAGEESFVKILRWLAQEADFRVVSTEAFLELMEGSLRIDLEDFAREFVYGTGVPRVFYTYSFEPRPDGRWHLSAEVERRKPYRYRYRVVEGDAGALDVVRETFELPTRADEVTLIVPLEIRLLDPARLPAAKGKRGRREREALEEGGNIKQTGHIALKGVTTPLEADFDFEPRSFELDPGEEILAQFYDLSERSKRVLLRRGREAMRSGEPEEARALFREALAVLTTEADDESLAALRDIRTRLELARLDLDRGRHGEAAGQLDAARALLKRVDSSYRDGAKASLDLLDCRLALHTGEPAEVVKRLEKRVLAAGHGADTESLLILATAAARSGDEEVLAEVLDLAESRRAKVVDLWRLREGSD